MASLNPSLQMALVKKGLSLMGLNLDGQKLAELAIVANQIEAGDHPESAFQSEEVQSIIAEVITPIEAPESAIVQSARCPHCKKSFIIDKESVR